MFRTLVLATTVASLLIGCSAKDPSTAAASNNVTAAVASGAAAPTNLPSWAKVYPGADVTQNVVLSTPEGVRGSVSFTTSAATADVQNFYKQAASDAGFAPGGGVGPQSYSDPKTGSWFSVTTAPTGMGLQVILVVHGQPS